MTDAQRDAVAKAHEILGEHFEAHVIITAAADESADTMDALVGHNGGYYTAIGLISRALSYYHTGFQPPIAAEPDDDSASA